MRPTMSCSSVTGADACALLRDDRLLVLATETIGTQFSAVALLDRHGHVLVHTRIRPTYPIPALADAPPLEVVWPTLAALLAGRIVASRELAADRRVLRQSARRLGATVMYAEWRRVGAGVCRSTRPMPTFQPSQSALTDARVTLAVLRALASAPTHVPPPPPRRFWRYL